jgi:hypothetical protein
MFCYLCQTQKLVSFILLHFLHKKQQAKAVEHVKAAHRQRKYTSQWAYLKHADFEDGTIKGAEEMVNCLGHVHGTPFLI